MGLSSGRTENPADLFGRWKMKHLTFAGLLFICAQIGLGTAQAQTNLLLNPHADSGLENWRLNDRATVEEFNGEKVFVIREQENGRISSFFQDVELRSSETGKYALLIGRGSSERI